MRTSILLADDDLDDTELFSEAVHEVDPPVLFYTASNGSEVLINLQSTKIQNPNIIFLDINMPSVNGWECLKALKQDRLLSSIPVIIYSTSSALRDKQRAAELGAIYFLTKPDRFEELKKFIRFVLNNVTTPHKISEYQRN